MTRPRLILAIRCCLVLCVAAVVGCWYPLAWLLVPVALFMPVFGSGGNVYVFSAPAFLRTVPSQTDWSTGANTNAAQAGPPGVLDRKNQVFYWVNGTTLASTTLAHWATPASASTVGTVAYSTSSLILRSIECDPTNSRVFYLNDQSGDNLRKINYDGSGDAAVINWVGSGASKGLRYDATSDKIYYVKHVGATCELRYCSPDGSGDALVSSVGATAINSIAIDVANRYLFWDEFFTVGPSTRIRRSAMDGSGVTTLKTYPGYSDAVIYFSQSQAKLHIAARDFTPNTKTTQMANDGSGEITLSDTATGGNDYYGPSGFALGDGLETVGAGAIL